MNVSAIIVTKGDHDVTPVLDSLPNEWEYVVWNNGEPAVGWTRPMGDGRISGSSTTATDLKVYGRYAAIEYASHDLIYIQDDDVIVSDPQAIVDAWVYARDHHDDGFPRVPAALRTEHLVANMPQEFRHDGYTDSCLVGFGSCFHRDLPARAFERFMAWNGWEVVRGMKIGDVLSQITGDQSSVFERTCDVVFTTLTPRVLVDVPKENRIFASDPDRMWRQTEHFGERNRMLELARAVRDA